MDKHTQRLYDKLHSKLIEILESGEITKYQLAKNLNVTLNTVYNVFDKDGNTKELSLARLISWLEAAGYRVNLTIKKKKPRPKKAEKDKYKPRKEKVKISEDL